MEIGNSLAAAGSVDNTLSMIVNLSESVIEGCDYAGIFVLERGVVTTLHHSAQIVFEYDGLQNRYGEGPCLDALHQNKTFYARWPYFGPPATAAGLRSVLALPLSATGPPTALNLYSELPRAFGALDRARGLLLAAFSSVALSSARVHRDDELLASNLHDALASREIIGQAQGILIERERITPEQAFNMLRSASQHLNVKLRDVAQALVDTGENTETGKRWSGRATPTGPGPAAPQPTATPAAAVPAEAVPAEAVPPEPTPPGAT
jgi:hypothetical protein